MWKSSDKTTSAPGGPGFWCGVTLAERLEPLIEPSRETNMDCAAYTLEIECELYISPTAAEPELRDSAEFRSKPPTYSEMMAPIRSD